MSSGSKRHPNKHGSIAAGINAAAMMLDDKNRLLQVHASLPWTVIDPRTDDILLPFHRNAAYCTNAPGGLNNSLFSDFTLPSTSNKYHFLKLQLLIVAGEDVPTGQQQGMGKGAYALINNNGDSTSISQDKQKVAFKKRLDETVKVFEFNEQQPIAELIIPLPPVAIMNARTQPLTKSSSSTSYSTASDDDDNGNSNGNNNNANGDKSEWITHTNARNNKPIFSVKVQRADGNRSDEYDDNIISTSSSSNGSAIRVFFKFMVNSGQHNKSKFSIKITPYESESLAAAGSTIGNENSKYTFPVFVMSKKNTIGTNAVTSLVCEKINLVSNNLKAQKMQKLKLAENSRVIIANSLAEVIKLTGCANEVINIIQEFANEARASSPEIETDGMSQNAATTSAAALISSLSATPSPSSRSKRSRQDLDDEEDDQRSRSDDALVEATAAALRGRNDKQHKNGFTPMDNNNNNNNSFNSNPSLPSPSAMSSIGLIPIKKFKIVSGVDMRMAPTRMDLANIPQVQQSDMSHLPIEPLLSLATASWIRDTSSFLHASNSANVKMDGENGMGMMQHHYMATPLPPIASNSFILPLQTTTNPSFTLSPVPTTSTHFTN